MDKKKKKDEDLVRRKNRRIRGKNFVEIKIFTEVILERFVESIKVKYYIGNLSICNMYRCRINYGQISILILYLYIYNYKNKNLININLACKLIDIKIDM